MVEIKDIPDIQNMVNWKLFLASFSTYFHAIDIFFYIKEFIKSGKVSEQLSHYSEIWHKKCFDFFG